jgi:hypothetical protein
MASTGKTLLYITKPVVGQDALAVPSSSHPHIYPDAIAPSSQPHKTLWLFKKSSDLTAAYFLSPHPRSFTPTTVTLIILPLLKKITRLKHKGHYNAIPLFPCFTSNMIYHTIQSFLKSRGGQ